MGTPTTHKLVQRFKHFVRSITDSAIDKRISNKLSHLAGDHGLTRLVYTNAVAEYLNSHPDVLSDIAHGNLTNEQIDRALDHAISIKITQETINISVDETIRAEFSSLEMFKQQIRITLGTCLRTMMEESEVDFESMVRENFNEDMVNDAVRDHIENEVNSQVDIEDMAREQVSSTVDDELHSCSIEDMATEAVNDLVQNTMNPNDIQSEIQQRLDNKCEEYIEENLTDAELCDRMRESVEGYDFHAVMSRYFTLDNPNFAAFFESKMNSIDFGELITPVLFGYLSDRLEELGNPHLLQLDSSTETTAITVHVNTNDVQTVTEFLNRIQGIKYVECIEDRESGRLLKAAG